MGFDTVIRIIADGAVVPVILIGSYMLVFKIPRGHRFEAYTRILLAGLTAYLIAKLIGSIYQPSIERPFELLGVQAGASFLNNPGFPSDHALFVTAITCAVWFETKHRTVSLILASLTLIVCVGRVLALVHTPTDVIFGVLIGLIGSLWYLGAQRPVKQSKPLLPH
ncbi:phosphatase PAP2 family protein [Candidatus Saccharibacteria bacterium]|nr:phosphatase PAP2 family protein [Candidatus Saccharibacteria bacterium]